MQDLSSDSQGSKRTGKKAFLSVNRLIINDFTYMMKTLCKLPNDLQPAKLSQRVDGEGKFTTFYSASSPMSSFYPANYVDNDGTPFDCSEQKYQYDKTVEFNDNASTHRILLASTALECFKIGQSIVRFKDKQWNKVAQNNMYQACKAKLEQNQGIASFLRDTQGTKLVEANPRDIKWSCRLSLKDKHLFNETAWKGSNSL